MAMPVQRHRGVGRQERPVWAPAAPITRVATAQVFAQVEDLPGRVTFEASDYLAPGLALLAAAFVVLPGARVDAQAGLHDPVQGRVRLPVAAPVEATVLTASSGSDLPRRRRSARSNRFTSKMSTPWASR